MASRPVDKRLGRQCSWTPLRNLGTRNVTVQILAPYPLARLQPAGERRTSGKEIRERICRSSHARWTAPSDRPDPIALLQRTDHSRLPQLVPIRYGRMLASPAAFL